MTAVTSGCLELAVSPGVEYPASCRLGEGIKLDFQRSEVPHGVCRLITVVFFPDLSLTSRSPRQSYEEEDSGVREAEVKLEQIQLDQESLEENMAIGEEERLYREEEEVQEQEEGEPAEQEVGLGGADILLSRGLVCELVLGAALLCLSSPLLLGIEPTWTLDVLSWHNLGLVPLLLVCCAFLWSLQPLPFCESGVFVPRGCGGFAMSLPNQRGGSVHSGALWAVSGFYKTQI